MELVKAIELFNSHRKTYVFKLEADRITFCEEYDKSKWSPRGFFSERVEEVVADYPLKEFNLPIPTGMETPVGEIARNIKIDRVVPGMASSYKTKTETIQEERVISRALDQFIINSYGEHRKFYTRYLDQLQKEETK